MTITIPAWLYDAVGTACNHHSIPMNLGLALSKEESRWDAQAVGLDKYTIDELRQMEQDYPDDWWQRASVAIGLFQLYTTGAGFGLHLSQFLDPSVNAEIGCNYLRDCLDAASDIPNALSAYNQGIGGWQERGILDEQRDWINRILTDIQTYDREGVQRQGSTPPVPSSGGGGAAVPPAVIIGPPNVPAVSTSGDVDNILGTLNAALQTVIDFLRDKAGALGATVASGLEAIRDGIGGAIKSVLGNVGTTLGGITNSITTAVQASLAATGSAIDAASNTIGTAIHDNLQTVYDTISHILDGLVAKAKEGINNGHDALDAAIAGIGTSFENIKTAIGNLRDDFTAKVGDVFQNVNTTLNYFLEKAKDWYQATVSDAELSLTAVRDSLKANVDAIIDGIKAGFQSFEDSFAPALKQLADNIGTAIWTSIFTADVPDALVEQLLAAVRAMFPQKGKA